MGKRSMNGEKIALNARCHFENLNFIKTKLAFKVIMF
jgi:hypothetical protein